MIVFLTTVCICSTTALVSYLYGKYHLNKYHKIRDQIEPFLWKIQNITFLFFWCLKWKHNCKSPIYNGVPLNPLSDQLCGRYYPFIWSIMWKILSLYLINDVEDIIPLSDQWCGRYYPFVEKPQLKIISFKIINLAILFILNLTKLLRLHCHLFSSKQ